MKIALVKPSLGTMSRGFDLEAGRMEPHQLGVLAALTPPDIETVLYDDRVEKIPFDDPIDLAAITVETFTARRSYEIADEFRARGVPVVLGGIHPTLIPGEAGQHADCIVLRDAENVWAELLEDARQKRLGKVYDGGFGPIQTGARPVMPRRDLYRGKGYQKVSLVQFGRGCRFNCTYCACSAFFGKELRFRPVEEVVREIRESGNRLFLFVDDNIAADREEAKKLFRALKPLGILWAGQASLDIAQDREFLSLMMKSGCVGNVFGFESLSRDDLIAMKKTPNLARFDDYRSQVQALKDAGMMIWASFSLGHDSQTADDIRRTVEFGIENAFSIVSYQILMPYPSTELYARLERENRLLYGGRWWINAEYAYNVSTFVPARMTPDELTAATREANHSFYSWGSVFRRAFDPKTNMRNPLNFFLYWFYNLMYRKTSI